MIPVSGKIASGQLNGGMNFVEAIFGLLFVSLLVLGGIAFWVFICHLIAKAAKAKGRSYAGFFCLSFFFSPLLGWIIVLAMAKPTIAGATAAPIDSTANASLAKSDGVELFKCPKCAEWIKAEAEICRFCGYSIANDVLRARKALEERAALQQIEFANMQRLAREHDKAVEEARIASIRDAKAAATEKRAMAKAKITRALEIARKPRNAILLGSLIAAIVAGSFIAVDAIDKNKRQQILAALSNEEHPNLVGVELDWPYSIEFEHPAFEMMVESKRVDGIDYPRYSYELFINEFFYQSGNLEFAEGYSGIPLEENTVDRMTKATQAFKAQIVIHRVSSTAIEATEYNIQFGSNSSYYKVIEVHER